MYPPGKLGFKQEGSGKVRVFAIPNALKQMLLRPAHDWCMRILRKIPMDGTFDQLSPLRKLIGLKKLRSYDLTSATDRFPLEFQPIVVESVFNRVVSWAWVVSGLDVNAFQTPRPHKGERSTILVWFATGQPMGCLSSWPLFALCHHILVWCAADRVYPNKVFRKYALLGDDLVIGDGQVAQQYKLIMDELQVKISKIKSLVSENGCCEFAKKFVSPESDMSPISVKSIRTAGYSIGVFPMMRQYGLNNLETSLRLRGAGYRPYSAKPGKLNPYYNRHWYRHLLIAFSPSGIRPLPFLIWLGFPEDFLLTPSQIGLVRSLIIENLRPSLDSIKKLEHECSRLLEDEAMLVESTIMVPWLTACCEYVAWWEKASVDYSMSIESLLDPPVCCLDPEKKNQINKFHRYGILFRCYDLVREQRPPCAALERREFFKVTLSNLFYLSL